MRTGIGMVHQEILLVQEYTVWQNIVLGQEPTGWLGRTDVARARKLVRQKIEEFSFSLDPDARVGDISVAARQKVEILKLLYRNVSVLILDEPTAVLTPQEIPQLFGELGRLRDNGHTILFISHRLDEVLRLTDRITVMRRAKVVGSVDTASTGKEELARMMVGRDVVLTSRRAPRQPGPPVCEIRGLSYTDPEGRRRLADIDLSVHRRGDCRRGGRGRKRAARAGERDHRPAGADRGPGLREGPGGDGAAHPCAALPHFLRSPGPRQDGSEPGCLHNGKRDHDAPQAGQPFL